MIVKMKFLSITGPRADIDRMTNRYLSKYEIHLENALAQLGQDQKNVTPYIEANPYREALNKAKEFEGTGSAPGQPEGEGGSADGEDPAYREADAGYQAVPVAAMPDGEDA